MKKKSINKDPRLIQSLEIQLWGKTVGFLALTSGGISFEYEEEFKKTLWNISPLEIPFSTTSIYTSINNGSTFKGLPGIFADSLPDNFGQKVIDNYFLQNYGITSQEVNPLMSLAYLHDRSIGALEYLPKFTSNNSYDDILSLSKLINAAKKTIQGKADTIATKIIQVGASAGGVKAKAFINYNPNTFEIRSGFNEVKADFVPCLIKFDGVMDGEIAGYNGKLEYIYNLVAADCGIEIPRCFLIESLSEDGLHASHFVTERFDRDNQKNKPFHVASYCGLTVSDFRIKNSSSYENFLRTVKGICSTDVTEVEKALKSSIFNLIMRNEDDHTKNFSFLMNQQGIWTLAPAYDLNYVRVPNGHQMSLNNKNMGFTKEDIINLGKGMDIKAHKTHRIIEEVELSARKFLTYADEVSLPEDFAQGVMRNFNWYL
jgi:serine/threonine-protein kinase HipA